jgi:hypothetical protein
MSDKPINKPAEKAIVVLHRMEPLVGRFEDAKKLSEEWFEFLKNIPDCKGVDVVCFADKQFAWLEEWSSRMAFDKFNEEHFAYADFSVRMIDCSRGIFTRHTYRKLS